ncbi:MAG: SIS domain-containing protein, partial [Candidatus Hydrothermarchaeaceae archaeon]
MKPFFSTMEELSKFIHELPGDIDEQQVDKFIGMLMETWSWGRVVLVVGAGRSGFVVRAFAMRLMHLGFRTHVLGETITPAVGTNDLILAVSGSGTTGIVVDAARAGKKVGAKVVAITSFSESPLAKMADHYVVIPGRTKETTEPDYFSRQILGIHEPLAPLGTLFEISCMVFLDSAVVELMHRMG